MTNETILKNNLNLSEIMEIDEDELTEMDVTIDEYIQDLLTSYEYDYYYDLANKVEEQLKDELEGYDIVDEQFTKNYEYLGGKDIGYYYNGIFTFAANKTVIQVYVKLDANCSEWGSYFVLPYLVVEDYTTFDSIEEYEKNKEIIKK